MPEIRTDTGDKPQQAASAVLSNALEDWQLPPLPSKLCQTLAGQEQTQSSLKRIGRLVRSQLRSARNDHGKARIELSMIDWLYHTIRLNIKRGRLFEINRVLEEKQADCLGYSKLFLLLGERFALDTGIVEIMRADSCRMWPTSSGCQTAANGSLISGMAHLMSTIAGWVWQSSSAAVGGLSMPIAKNCPGSATSRGCRRAASMP